MALQNVIEEYIKLVKIDKDYELSLTDVYFDPLGNKITIKTIAEYFYKQALKDMEDRAEELQLPHLRMYKKIAEELGK